MNIYYYFPPLRPQYYFPSHYEKYSLFLTFYQSFTIKGRAIWYLWNKFFLIRKLFKVSDIENIIPIKTIFKHINSLSILAFNSGSTGPEQKITILGYDKETNAEFFIKYANTKIARKNVSNESFILKQLIHFDFVPVLLLSVDTIDYTLIKTSVLKGNRIRDKVLDNNILNILLLLPKLLVKTNFHYDTNVKNCFGHGDFCPWNLIIHDDQIKVYDWELAGSYPLGYDLFTFIFQTSFLLYPKVRIPILIKENIVSISNYFNFYGETSWKPFLFAFASIRYSIELKKRNKRLISPFHQLMDYAAKV